MKKTYIILAGAVIIVAIAIGTAFWLRFGQKTPAVANNNAPAVANMPPVSTNSPLVNSNAPVTMPETGPLPANSPVIMPKESTTGTTDTITLRIGFTAKLGGFLTATNGHTLYYFTNDSPGKSTCTDACAANWPAYTIPAGVTPIASLGAGGGGNGAQGKTGTIKRADGSLQVTYNDQPLYYWHLDKVPGDALGQGIGGVWFVQRP